MLGIAGSGMRGLADLLADRGAVICGTDRQVSVLGEPALASYDLAPEEDAARLLEGAARVIYSDAVPSDHELRVLARARGLIEQPYHVALGELTRHFRTVAVAGTHGKSSTSAVLAHLLVEGGLDPSALIGAPVLGWGRAHARVGRGEWFVVEADEYREHFLQLAWQAAVVCSIDFDHPDYFASLREVERAYSAFLLRSPNGWVAVPTEVRSAHPDVHWPAHTDAVAPDMAVPPLRYLPGAHMQRNAALAVAAAVWCGVPREAALAALRTFRGVGRRFEELGVWHGVTVISDYGHHPAEIAATLLAARQRVGRGRLLVIFEPHTAERLVQFVNEFVQALRAADGVLVVPTYQPPGRTRGTDAAGARAHLLAGLREAGMPVYEASFVKLAPTMARVAREYDVSLGFSAGALDGALRRLVRGETSLCSA